jgi:glycosyltransferase involved in cell wall biosynthesis
VKTANRADALRPSEARNQDSPWPKISIVTPSYNQAQYIDETIQSVVSQDYLNLEYIVIDGGSTDGSQDVIRAYADKLAYWISEPDRGQPNAINKGFAKATGAIYGFLNSDDVYQPDTLKRVVDAYLKHPDKSRFWHAFAVEDFDENGSRFVHRPKAANRLADWVDFKANLHQPGVFWSREMYWDIGGFDDELQYAFDRKFFASALLKGYRITIEPNHIATRFRHHLASKTASVGNVNNLGFAPEFNEISEWMVDQATPAQRLLIHLGRITRKQESVANDLLFRETVGGLRRLAELACAGTFYPPITRSRYFWGAVRKAATLTK